MENKKYLDKVVDHLLIGTKLDNEEGTIIYPFSLLRQSYIKGSIIQNLRLNIPHFISYCKKQFGLIDDEVRYVFNRYVDIIIDKLKDGE